jgi:nucleoside-diphosphate-sugar epimerase
MNIAILGARAFLAQALQTALRQAGFSHIQAFHRQASTPELHFDYPQHYPKAEELLQYDLIYYCAGAGIQPGHQDANSLIFALNAFLPIEYLAELERLGYTGKVITFGSYFELGDQQAALLRDEDFLWQHHQALPNAYCRAKNLLSRYIGQRLQTPLPFCLQHFVLTNIYGYGENPQRLFPYLFQTALRQEPLQFTAGSQIRQYTHVRDIADFLVTSLSTTTSGIFNLSHPDCIRVRSAIELALGLVGKQLGAPPQAVFGQIEKRDSSMAFLGLQTEKIKALGGFQPKISLEEGLLEYLAHLAQ